MHVLILQILWRSIEHSEQSFLSIHKRVTIVMVNVGLSLNCCVSMILEHAGAC